MQFTTTTKYFHVTSNAVQSIFTTQGMFGGYYLDNTANAATTYYQFFYKASTAVSLGTTVADFVIPVPAGLGANLPVAISCPALSFAVTTTYNGSTAPGSPIDCTFFIG